MTERATGNGYSWWWASHIRTKQSKWLEQNLQDMEDKVEHVLNLIQKDGDSFARRAEMYYKHRPEVINFVEETVRGYRSLAERYDKLSTELQKANTTIASICPDKVTYEDDDDYTVTPTKVPKKASQKATKIPKAPKPPAKGALNNTSKASVKPKDDQDQLSQDAKLAQQQFDEAKSKLESLKEKFNLEQVNNDVELGDSIDMLVNKMISLETSVTSQRKENDDLQKQIQNLEAEKAALMNKKNVDDVETKGGQNDEVKWLKMLLRGLDNKDDILLEEYITILKCYKDAKKKLSEEEKRNQGTLSSMKYAIAKRDNAIQSLVQKLKSLQESLGEEDKVDIPSIDFDEPQLISASEEKLRADIDTILDQNLDLWLRFSNMFRLVHKFKTQVKGLQEQVKKVNASISDIKPIYKHLRGINAQLTAWLQQSMLLEDEFEMMNARLSHIQEEVTKALREGVEEGQVKFSAHQAAKFKGEILNMKQENNKVSEELEAGLDHAIALKQEVEQTIERLEKEYGVSKGRSSRRSVSLKSLLFGGKSKKQKFSFFSCLGHHKRTRSI